MYSNSSLGAVARSIKIEDIEKISSFTGNSNKEYIPMYGSYPNIFALEESGAPNGTYGSLGRSEQDSYITGLNNNNISKGKKTYYSYEMSTYYMNSTYLNMFKNSQEYWLASRCIDYGQASMNWFSFCIFYINQGTIFAWPLYDSFTGNDGYGMSVRPVVEIKLSQVNVGLTGDGSSSTPYSIEAK